eukprot:1704061-Pyramimonas_sp.AAC.1
MFQKCYKTFHEAAKEKQKGKQEATEGPDMPSSRKRKAATKARRCAKQSTKPMNGRKVSPLRFPLP